MSGTPDVSVVVPTYQRAAFLGASLESLLAQEGVAFEVVVVDDGSTDGTAELLAAQADARIRPLIRRHGGIAAASGQRRDTGAAEGSSGRGIDPRCAASPAPSRRRYDAGAAGRGVRDQRAGDQ